jgi:hypothetical protein
MHGVGEGKREFISRENSDIVFFAVEFADLA